MTYMFAKLLDCADAPDEDRERCASLGFRAREGQISRTSRAARTDHLLSAAQRVPNHKTICDNPCQLSLTRPRSQHAGPPRFASASRRPEPEPHAVCAQWAHS